MRAKNRPAHLPVHSLGHAIACVLSCAAAAVAQGGEVSGGVLEEIIVTTQKRAENLQEVPLAVTAYGGDFLERNRVENLWDLRLRVPGLVYDQHNAGLSRIYIRGIGNNVRSGAVDEDVGTFIDGVYIDRPSMANIEFADLQRVEVLRGPQGTLFGRNVVGGAISYTTRAPDAAFRAGGDVTVGNYHQRDATAFVSGALSDTVFAKVSAVSRNHDGYAFNTTTGNDVEDRQLAGGRAALRFQPNENLDIQLSADASRIRGTGNWWILAAPGALPTAQSELDSPNPRRAAHYPDDGINNVDNSGYSLTVNWQTRLGTFTSISAYREAQYDARADVNALPVPDTLDPSLVVGQMNNLALIQDYHERAHQVSQEFRLTSAPGALRWVTGLYYFHNNVSFSNGADPYVVLFPFLQATGSYAYDQNAKTDAYAVFGNVSYDLLDTLTLQAGLRYSHDDKEMTGLARGINFIPWTVNGVIAPDGYTAAGEASWHAWTPALSINYQVVPNKYLYAAVARGFKSGGFAAGTSSEKIANETPFNPEYAWNYEIGAKTEWLDRRLRLNVAGFWVDYSDLQLRTFVQPPGAPIQVQTIGNAGETTSKGIESELNVAIGSALNLFANYTYMKTEIDEMILSGVDVAGQELTRAPHHKGSVGASYVAPISAGLNLSARAEYAYTSSYFTNIPNRDVERVDSQTNLDAGLGLESADGRWTIEVWGKNLTDEVRPFALQAVNGSGVSGMLDAPRTYGITVRVRN